LSTLALVCILILSIQIIYWLLFYIGVNKGPSNSPQPPHPVSVIVCAHDEEQNLRELIPVLLAQDHPEFEIIIVEDRCNDGTYDYLREATAQHSQLKMVRVVHKPEHISGKKFALTLGIKAAKYEWLLFTDADCRPASAQWIKSMTQNYDEQTQLVLGCSPYEKKAGWLNAFIRFESLLTVVQYVGLANLGNPYMGVGRNLAYTKSIFLKNKGFNEYLEVTGGDDDLFVNKHATKNNTRVCLGAEAVTISTPETNWSDFFHQKLRHLSVGKRYRFADKAILALFSTTWLLTWFFILPTIYFSQAILVVAALFLVRWMLIGFAFTSASRKIGGHFEAWKAPFLDFIFAFYYLVTGLRALVVKKIRWKN
jgi:cellulose synthase/poly-beta-1,6-N-acetylglucosamine synthase-like glycosyltransferase